MDATESTKGRGERRVFVLCLITALTGGGAEMMLYRLLSRLDPTRFKSQVISMMEPGPVGDKILSLGVPVRSLGMTQGKVNPLALVKLVRWLRQDKPDVIQTWMYHADLAGGMAAMLAGGIPVSWGIRHSELSSEVNRRLTLLTVRTCSFLSRWLPTKIVCCSEASLKIHATVGYAAEKMVMIPNGIDPELFHPNPHARLATRMQLGLPATAPVVGMIGRFDPHKDHGNFIRAARILAHVRPDVRFILCGEEITWENDQLVKWIEAEGLVDRFMLLGKRDDISNLVNAFDVATLSSLGEGFPNVVLEAMACGVPSVVTDVGDSALIVGDTGLVVPRRDPLALAEAWRKVLEMDPAARAELGLSARRRAISKYSLGTIVSHYEQLFEELAGSRTPRIGLSVEREYVRH